MSLITFRDIHFDTGRFAVERQGVICCVQV